MSRYTEYWHAFSNKCTYSKNDKHGTQGNFSLVQNSYFRKRDNKFVILLMGMSWVAFPNYNCVAVWSSVIQNVTVWKFEIWNLFY